MVFPSYDDKQEASKDGTGIETFKSSDSEENVDSIAENIRGRIGKPMWVVVVGTILSSTFLFALDNTIVADVQVPIVDDLGELEKLSWLGVAFVLASSATVVTWGKLYGIFSAKWLYCIAIILFEVGSAVCGAAPTMNAMIIGRAIAGVGGAGMYVGCLTLLTLTTSIRERPNYMAFIGITWGVGTVLGPVYDAPILYVSVSLRYGILMLTAVARGSVGGAFAENESATWRWAFYINLCIGAAFAPIYLLYLPRGDPQKGVRISRKALQLDFLGIPLNIGAFTALILGISFGGTEYDWSDGREIALWVVGGVLLAAFVMQQGWSIGTTRARRTFPADFLRRGILINLFCLMSAAATCVFVPTFYIPLYFQFVRGDSPLTAAIRLLPFIGVMVFFGLLNGALMSKFGYYMPWFLTGGVFATIGGSLMYTVDKESANARVYGYTVVIAVGAGCFIQASFAVAQAKVPRSRASDAGGYIALAQNLGIVLGLSISGSVFQNVAIGSLKELLPAVPVEALRGAVSGANSDLLSQLPPETADAVLSLVVAAMSKTYILVITAGAMTIVGSLFMSRERLFLEIAAAG